MDINDYSDSSFDSSSDNEDVVDDSLSILHFMYFFHLFPCSSTNNNSSVYEWTEEQKLRRDRRFPRIALRYYNDSPFKYMYDSGNNQSLLHACACDHQTFHELVHLFGPVYDWHTVDKTTGDVREKSRGGPRRHLDPIEALGLILFWFRTRGACTRNIAMVVGLTATPMYKWLKFSRRILLFVLQNNCKAKVCNPTPEEIVQYQNAIAAKYPRVAGVWAAMDGLKLPLEQCSNYFIQNIYYNGWCKDTYISNVFLFAPDGKIRMCVINCPGSWHDSTLAQYGLYKRMEKIYNEYGAKVVVDSAFRGMDNPFLIKSL